MFGFASITLQTGCLTLAINRYPLSEAIDLPQFSAQNPRVGADRNSLWDVDMKQAPLFDAWRRLVPLGARQLDKPPFDGKQGRWQRPEISGVAVDRPHIRSRLCFGVEY
jgi:hypothetical protein